MNIYLNNMKDISRHPCFAAGAKHKYARVHLPVAPRCNIQCSYCNRKYDCCNESRPGVASAVLSPMQSVRYLKALLERMPRISVIGIAGPGDPFANPEETIQTLKMLKHAFSDKIFCLSTNGLDLFPFIDDLSEAGVSHVTITINSLRMETLSEMYHWIRYNRQVYRGEEAGRILLEQQLKCIPRLKEKGMIVKINTVICPGINDCQAGEIARQVAALGADVMNCIPLYPAENTAFEELTEPSGETMRCIKMEIAQYIKPMLHCARCRADAAGLLGEDNTEAMNMIRAFSRIIINKGECRSRVAVACSLPDECTMAH